MCTKVKNVNVGRHSVSVFHTTDRRYLQRTSHANRTDTPAAVLVRRPGADSTDYGITNLYYRYRSEFLSGRMEVDNFAIQNEPEP